MLFGRTFFWRKMFLAEKLFDQNNLQPKGQGTVTEIPGGAPPPHYPPELKRTPWDSFYRVLEAMLKNRQIEPPGIGLFDFWSRS